MSAAETELPVVVQSRRQHAAAALCESAGVPPGRMQQAHFHERLAEASGSLGEAAFQAAWDAGRAMTLEQAVACALSDDPE